MIRDNLEHWLNRIWYAETPPPAWLMPLSCLYCTLVRIRRKARRAGLLPAIHPGVTTVVVGNLTVGGTGKTPFVTALVCLLSEQGLHVGIITRGYGGKAANWPHRVTADSDPYASGDEAVLLAQSCAVPVYAGSDRLAAARALLAENPVDVLVSDDGLQHEQLGRDIEIVMIDPLRGFGNRHCLPAGPLREPVSRLQQVDTTVALGEHPEAGFHIASEPGDAINLLDPHNRRPLGSFANQPCHAVAGISNPGRFFGMLNAQGLQPDTRHFGDHHPFIEADIRFDDDFPVLMTAKDAVKCRAFAGKNCWYVPLELNPGPAFTKWLLETLKRKKYCG
ncbi:lipid-A-disaccharide kinase [Thiogranum longum]|uniref:Tetraacyldisaccharide 4'-kinase n=1 Tax=Thiogranum longum TaxID=1537524 RepID=A0A4V2PGW1_9GAMM|nr:tetraacyldisaccharide 4'-kinase [Thiogranum longum]TCK18366.1 lipid-A-disaccharide kinase [Thiogranum longum]